LFNPSTFNLILRKAIKLREFLPDGFVVTDNGKEIVGFRTFHLGA